MSDAARDPVNEKNPYPSEPRPGPADERFRTLIEDLPDSYYRFDLEGRLVYANRRGRQALAELGLDPTARPSIERIMTSSRANEDIRETMRERGRVDNVEVQVRGEDGAVRTSLLTAQVVFDEEGRPVGAEGLARDVTEILAMRGELARKVEEVTRAYDRLKEAQSHLVQREKMASLGTLMAGIAHEITNPVNFVSGNLDFISGKLDEFLRICADRLPSGSGRGAEWKLDLQDILADLRESVNDSTVGLKRVKDIVKNLRAFSRVGSPQYDLVDVEEALDGTIRLLVFEFKDRSITVEKRYGSVPPRRLSAGEMNQVFMNLLVNAFQAAGEGGTVTVETRLAGETIEVAVSDTGPGVPAEIRDSIFEPFFTTKAGGVGLGLSISFEIVRHHGGAIRHEEREGGGTTFVVSLPRKDEA